MKNKTIYLFIIMLLMFVIIIPNVQATDSSLELINEQEKKFGISDFVKEANNYSGAFFEDIDISDLLSSAITGNIDNTTILKKILSMLGLEVTSTIKTLIGILVIVLIHSILKSFTDNIEENNISKIIYYVQYILIVTLIMGNFTNIINSIITTINNLAGFTESLIPLLVTLMLYTGSITTSSMIEPIILLVIEFVENIIIDLIIPMVSIITALIIVSKISDKIQLSKMTQFLKSSVVWFLGIILTMFVGVVSLEGTLTSSVDGITAKTAKAAVSSLIPVVGKILGDSVDSILGCGLVLKNAVGVVGVIVIIGICIVPIIKLATMSIMYCLSSAIIEPLADEKIVKLLDEIGRYI